MNNMMLYIDVGCAIFTVITIWAYFMSGVYSRAHRMLPLLLGIIAVFCFYQIIKLRTGQMETFHLLEDYMLVQVLYVIWVYVLDYHDVRFPNWLMMVMLFVLLGSDIGLYHIPLYAKEYHILYIGSCTVFIFLIIGTILHSYANFRYSKEERNVNRMLLCGLAIPAALASYQNIYKIEHGSLLLITFEIPVAMFLYLILSGKLLDTRFVLNDRVFEETKNPILLFDESDFLLAANSATLEYIPQLRSEDHIYVRDAKVQDAVSEYMKTHRENGEIQIFGRTFYMDIQHVEYRELKRGYIASFYDITDSLEQIEEAKKQAYLRAQFLARSSHDLRSPLHAIIGVSEMLVEKKDISRNNRVLLEHIHHSGKSLLRIVNSILDYSKMEAGSIEIAQQPYEVEDMVRELSQICLVNLREKPVEFTFEITSQFPATLIGDRVKVSEMMENVLSNAVKFTETGSVRAFLQAKEDGDSYRVEFVVKDTGIGMNREQLDAVFEEYISYATANNKEGTGLGMSILKGLSKLMGGDVFAKSEEGRGSEIGFYIYQKKTESSEMLEPQVFDVFRMLKWAGEVENVQPDYVYPQANVLLADDMEINCQIFERMTMPWGFQLDKVENGLQAVECVKKKKYDLIFLDFMMPVMSGDEAVVEIKKLTDAPVMLLSANVYGGNMDKYLELGFERILSKPLDMQQIKASIQNYLPEELRCPAPENVGQELGQKQLEGRRRTLMSFHKELSDAVETLPNLYKEDQDNYRIRVHGIKGAARQLELEMLGDESEIQEMAVKAKHFQYIENHMEEYLSALAETNQEIEAELYEITQRIQSLQKQEAQKPTELAIDFVEISAMNQEAEQKKDYRMLIEALESYDIALAEELLSTLRKRGEGEEEKRLIDSVSQAIQDFEYEEALRILEEGAKQ